MDSSCFTARGLERWVWLLVWAAGCQGVCCGCWVVLLAVESGGMATHRRCGLPGMCGCQGRGAKAAGCQGWCCGLPGAAAIVGAVVTHPVGAAVSFPPRRAAAATPGREAAGREAIAAPPPDRTAWRANTHTTRAATHCACQGTDAVLTSTRRTEWWCTRSPALPAEASA